MRGFSSPLADIPNSIYCRRTPGYQSLPVANDILTRLLQAALSVTQMSITDLARLVFQSGQTSSIEIMDFRKTRGLACPGNTYVNDFKSLTHFLSGSKSSEQIPVRMKLARAPNQNASSSAPRRCRRRGRQNSSQSGRFLSALYSVWLFRRFVFVSCALSAVAYHLVTCFCSSFSAMRM